MLTNVSYQLVKLIRPNERLLVTLKRINNQPACTRLSQRYFYRDRKVNPDDQDPPPDLESNELVQYKAQQLLEKEFPDYYSEGKFISRISYVDFIDQALAKLKELGLAGELSAYKELLKVFPPGKYHPSSIFDIALHHAPQQLCGIRLLDQMELNGVRPDKELEILVVKAFSKNSDVWKKAARMMYWSMKGKNVDLYPLPEKLPQRPEQLAKYALARMIHDYRSVVSVTSTHSLPHVIDKTWVVYSHSPIQKFMIEKLDEKTTLYIEDAGRTFVGQNYLSYFILKVYDDDETTRIRQKKVEKDWNFNTLKVQFYGKPIKVKTQEIEEAHHVDNYRILAVGMTGTSSHDSVLSWLKIMQIRIPKLSRMNVIFRLNRPTYELEQLDAKERDTQSANVG